MPFGYAIQPVKAVISDVTGSRAIDGTVYQNSSGRPKLVIITTKHVRKLDNEICVLDAYVEDITPPTVKVASVGLTVDIITESAEAGYWNMVFAVPNQNYYKALENETGTAIVTLMSWIEVEL